MAAKEVAIQPGNQANTINNDSGEKTKSGEGLYANAMFK